MRAQIVMVLAQIACATFSGMESQMRMAAEMEAQMESQVVQEHTARLEQFGMSFKKDEPATADSDIPRPGAADPEAPPAEEYHPSTILAWIHLLSFAFALKAGAISSSVALTLSPLRAIHNMQQAKSTLVFSPLPFFCVFACGIQWCLYGTFAFLVTGNYGFLILVYSNCLGVVMGTYYVYNYVNVCDDEARTAQCKQCGFILMCTFGAQALIIPTMHHATALLIVGTVAACKSVCVTAAPFADFDAVFYKHDVSSMPKDIVVASFVASVLWFGCAILLHDTWILVPNFAGVVVGSVQLSMLAKYGDLLTPKDGITSGKAFYGATSCKGAERANESLLIGSDCEGPGGTADVH